MNRIALAALAGASMILAGTASAQQADRFAKAQIMTTDLGHDTYMLQGVGGNMTLAVGKDGAILVDTEFAPLHDKIEAAIKAVTDKPVRYVINTHYHGDHTGGDQAFWLAGAEVVAHENVKKRMEEGVTNALTGTKTPPVPQGGLPTKTYSGASTTVSVKGRAARVTHVPAAHTDGDSVVYFPDANVLATGDITSGGLGFPNIDIAAGGGIKGMIADTDMLIKRVNAKTKVVPGHGPLIDRAGMIEYRAMLVSARDRIAKLMKDGMTEDQVVAAKPLADIQAKNGANDMAAANFERLVYRSLKA